MYLTPLCSLFRRLSSQHHQLAKEYEEAARGLLRRTTKQRKVCINSPAVTYKVQCYPWICHFEQKRYPVCIPFFKKWWLFHMPIHLVDTQTRAWEKILSNHKVNPKNKRFSSFLANGPITFLPETVQVSSISFKVFNGCIVEPWILLVHLQKTCESFECPPHCKNTASLFWALGMKLMKQNNIMGEHCT